MRIAMVCQTASGRFDPEVGRGFGGLQVRASLFAHGLAASGAHQVRFVVPNSTQRRRCDVGPIEAIELPFAEPYGSLGRIAAGVRKRLTTRGATVDGAPTWPAALGQLPLAAVHHALFRRDLRRGWSARMARGLAAVEADVMCCFQPNRYTASAVAGCRRVGRPVVTMIASDVDLGDHVYRGSRERGPTALPGHMCWYAIAQADEVVVQTTWQQRRLRERFGREGVLIRNPIDLSRRSDAGPPMPEPYVFWVGRGDTAHKRPAKCFELAERLPERRFVMVMNPVDDAQQAALKSQAPANVQIIDRLPYDEIEAYFRHASLFVSTSGFEGFPNTFLQAAKYGVPIVSLAIDPDNVLTEHQLGTVCGGDVDAAAAAIETLMGDDATRTRYGAAARRYVEAHHGLTERVHELEHVLTTLAHASRPAGRDTGDT